MHTELNHDGEMFLALHAYLFGTISHLAITLHVKIREWPDPTALTAKHLTRYSITNRSDENFIRFLCVAWRDKILVYSIVKYSNLKFKKYL